ncbi:MAG: hypothetical protein A2W33_04480 [Chloroflexi bacterium RBG_16_52_11]|nr:MAG: hypothetical protein A2W33_04480 [Chloroflexi bacterium RBG_16_52_11]
MIRYDPPSDPYGDERRCRICDHPLTLVGWECVQDHDALEPDTLRIRPQISILSEVSARAAGSNKEGVKMFGKLLCKFGFHSWIHPCKDGDDFRVCARPFCTKAQEFISVYYTDGFGGGWVDQEILVAELTKRVRAGAKK